MNSELLKLQKAYIQQLENSKATVVATAVRQNYTSVVEPGLKQYEAEREQRKADSKKAYDAACATIDAEIDAKKTALAKDNETTVTALVGSEFDQMITAQNKLIGVQEGNSNE